MKHVKFHKLNMEFLQKSNFPDFPTVSLPVVQFGDTVVTGPIPVAQHLARLTGFGGKGNLEMIAADDIFAFVESFYESEFINNATLIQGVSFALDLVDLDTLNVIRTSCPIFPGLLVIWYKRLGR